MTATESPPAASRDESQLAWDLIASTHVIPLNEPEREFVARINQRENPLGWHAVGRTDLGSLVMRGYADGGTNSRPRHLFAILAPEGLYYRWEFA